MKQIKKQQFDITDSKKLEDMGKALEEIITFDKFELAFDISNGLKQFINDSSNFNIEYPELYQGYQKIIIKMRWIALHLLDNKEIIKLFEEYFVDIFDIQFYDIEEKLHTKMLTILVYSERDKLKKSLQKALANNQQELTSKQLKNGINLVTPTIANWVIDYTKKLGVGVINKTKQAEYFIRSDNMIGLSNDDKKKIKILFKVYEKLKLSSLAAPGMEDNISVDEGEVRGTLTGTGFEPIHNEKQIAQELEWANNILLKADIPDFIKSNIEKEKDEVLLEENINNKGLDNNIKHKNGKEELQVKWQDFLKNWLMVEVMEAIAKNSSKDVYEMKDMRSQFYHTVNKHDAKDALVSLLMIAEHGNIKQAFGDDERYQKFWGSYLESSFAKATEDERNNLDDGQFKDNPAQVKYLAMFFKYIMEERLKLDQDQAVMIGVMLANLCRQAQEIEYQQMAYGDIESGEFRWNI